MRQERSVGVPDPRGTAPRDADERLEARRRHGPSGGEERRASAPAEPSSQRVGRDQLLLEARGVGLERKDGRVVLRDVDLEVAPGEILGIVGKNGAGKSTLLRVLAGLLLPACGRVLLEGFDLSSLERREIARRIAFLPQEVPADLPFTAREVALMGRSPHLGPMGLDGPEDRRIAEESLHQTGTLELADRPFFRLSGGERQRVWIARALAQRAPLWLFDEPTAHLDLAQQRLVLDLLRRHAARGGAAVAVLHDLGQAARVCDRVLVLDAGRPIALGPPHEILTPERLESVFGLRFARGGEGSSVPVPEWDD
ncbi:MAG: ABC transporter ATP-binding protein [Pseudomonadota bacterium]|nr:MAG: hypothetical protein DIU72_00850 [Pseudomonadota bacterium]